MDASRDLIGKRSFPRFPITNEACLIEADRDIRLEPLPRPPGMEDWAYARITTPQESVHTWFRGNSYDEDKEALLQELFVWDELIVSERVKDLINGFAPEFCYFSPMKLMGQASGQPHPTPYFKTLIRHALEYIGSEQLPRHKEAPRFPVRDKNWSGLCETPAFVQLATQLPIFIFGRRDSNPILNAALYLHFESPQRLRSDRVHRNPAARVPGVQGYETVSPLNPGPDVALR